MYFSSSVIVFAPTIRHRFGSWDPLKADMGLHIQKKCRTEVLTMSSFKIRYDRSGWQSWPDHTVTADGGWDLGEYKFTNCRQPIQIDGLSPIKQIRLCDRCLTLVTQIANWIHPPWFFIFLPFTLLFLLALVHFISKGDHATLREMNLKHYVVLFFDIT